MSRLARSDATIAASITEYRRIIAFRNVLIHNYDTVDDETTWRVVQNKLPVLIAELERLLVNSEDPPSDPPSP